METKVDIAAIAELTVRRWISSGRLPETAFDFRGLIADGIGFALAEAGHPSGLAWVQNVCGKQVDAPSATSPRQGPSTLPKTAADLGNALLQMHALHENRGTLMPSAELGRLNTFAGKLAQFIDSAKTGRELMTLLGNLEAAFELASKSTLLNKDALPVAGVFDPTRAGGEAGALMAPDVRAG